MLTVAFRANAGNGCPKEIFLILLVEFLVLLGIPGEQALKWNRWWQRGRGDHQERPPCGSRWAINGPTGAACIDRRASPSVLPGIHRRTEFLGCRRVRCSLCPIIDSYHISSAFNSNDVWLSHIAAHRQQSDMSLIRIPRKAHSVLFQYYSPYLRFEDTADHQGRAPSPSCVAHDRHWDLRTWPRTVPQP